MNKHERKLKGVKKMLKRAIECGWEDLDDLPLKTKIALSNTGNIRINQRDGRKRFGKSSGKRLYGHFSGYCQWHLDKTSMLDRIHKRESEI